MILLFERDLATGTFAESSIPSSIYYFSSLQLIQDNEEFEWQATPGLDSIDSTIDPIIYSDNLTSQETKQDDDDYENEDE